MGRKMKETGISFTMQELRLLVQLAYTGSHVINEVTEDDRMRRELLIDKILKAAWDAKAMSGIRYDPALHGYFFDDKTEDAILHQYEEFMEMIFWDELSSRLALRDLLAKEGTEALLQMNEEEIEKLKNEYQEKYIREFQLNGIKNIGII
jgi:hypothetical protein